MAHGSKNHREPGSIGAGTTPSRVIKGKRMAGNMGNERVTITKLKLVKVDSANGLVLVKGSVPGCEGRLVTIVPTRTKWNKFKRKSANKISRKVFKILTYHIKPVMERGKQ